MKREITIYYRRKKRKIIVEDCNALQKAIGLMFSFRESARILLFSFERKQKIRIHSFFVFYPFAAVWLDEKNKIVDLKIVKPFVPCISHNGKADKLIEIPINEYYKYLVGSLFPTTKRNI